MRIAFGIVSLFPGGGLQRDCVEIAKLVRDQQHEVVIHACRLRGHEPANDIPVMVLQNHARTNHDRQYTFAVDFQKTTSGRYDLVVGFDKLLGLDVLYCADASIAFRMLKRPYLNLLPRYRTYKTLEKSSFARNTATEIIVLDDNQIIEYQSAWGTQLNRMIVVPPTLSPGRRRPECRTSEIRQRFRSQLGLGQDDWVWLSVGVQPLTKGLDRTIEALASFAHARLLIAGLTETDRTSERLAERARRIGVDSRIIWLGHREEIPQLMAAADLLVHPARYDTTGTVILEAVVNGLPVIATAACGYARHVEAAHAGIALREPFQFSLFVGALNWAKNSAVRHAWSAAGEKYGQDPILYKGRMRAAEILLQAAARRSPGAPIVSPKERRAL
jgi:UDP-glucose:(heptosyl)LPS alpha-1,3-glucosyltransferase